MSWHHTLHNSASIAIDLLLGTKSKPILNEGSPRTGSEHPARSLLQAGRALLAAAANEASGRVDYSHLQASSAYRSYRELARALRAFSPASLETPSQAKAFWINLYNALIVDAVIQYGISRSVMRDRGMFRRAAYLVGGLRYSADDIEHGILRRNRPHPYLRLRPFQEGDPRLEFMVPEFDPRIHFALVCAANSCPPIAFYSGDRLDQQLDMAVQAFLRGGGASVESQGGILFLSRIFKWYLGDFGGKRGLLDWLSPRLALETDELDGMRVRYQPYDWGLNRV